VTASIGREREQRGRPRGNSNAYYAHLKSIVTIASKHDVDPKRLVDAFVEAWENMKAQCGPLTISRRKITRDSATFLITKEEKVIWQFPVNLESVRNPDILKKHIQDIPLPQSLEQKQYQKKQQIDNLRFGMKGIDVKAKIVEIQPTKPVITRWGSESDVTNVMIADETGSIRLSLWNNQIDEVHVGDEVELKNCYVSRFAGKPQLRLQRKSTMSVINQLAS
jgi:replication factor A1